MHIRTTGSMMVVLGRLWLLSACLPRYIHLSSREICCLVRLPARQRITTPLWPPFTYSQELRDLQRFLVPRQIFTCVCTGVSGEPGTAWRVVSSVLKSGSLPLITDELRSERLSFIPLLSSSTLFFPRRRHMTAKVTVP